MRLTSGGSGVSDGCSNVAGDSLPFPNTSAEDDATRKPRRSIFIVDGFEIMEICREFSTLSRTLCNTGECLLRIIPIVFSHVSTSWGHAVGGNFVIRVSQQNEGAHRSWHA